MTTATSTITDTERVLIAVMDALINFHDDADHDYMSECDCDEAAVFTRAKDVLAARGIDFDTAPRG